MVLSGCCWISVSFLGYTFDNVMQTNEFLNEHIMFSIYQVWCFSCSSCKQESGHLHTDTLLQKDDKWLGKDSKTIISLLYFCFHSFSVKVLFQVIIDSILTSRLDLDYELYAVVKAFAFTWKNRLSEYVPSAFNYIAVTGQSDSSSLMLLPFFKEHAEHSESWYIRQTISYTASTHQVGVGE